MQSHRVVGLALFCMALLGGALSAGAEMVTVPFHDAGFFGEDGRSSKEDAEALGKSTTVPTFANHHVGLSAGYEVVDPGPPAVFADAEVRNYFVFDWADVLTALGGPPPGPIVSATLGVYNPSEELNGEDGYISPDATETYLLSDTGSKSPTEVMDHYDHPDSSGPFAGTDESGDAIAVYTELASGPTFGLVEMSAADNGDYVEIPFTAMGVDFLNLKLGEFSGGGDTFFAFGGKLTTIGGSTTDATDDPFEEVFGFTHPNGEGSPDTSATPPVLALEFIPEPSALMMLAPAWTAMGWRRRRRPGC